MWNMKRGLRHPLERTACGEDCVSWSPTDVEAAMDVKDFGVERTLVFVVGNHAGSKMAKNHEGQSRVEGHQDVTTGHWMSLGLLGIRMNWVNNS